MGTYLRRTPQRARTISEALNEAEGDHFLDCPDADFWIRTGAILLDGIFFYLLWNGLKHTFNSMGPAVVAHLNLTTLVPLPADRIVPFFLHVAHGFLYFLYFCATLAQFGGSPGKLLLGLRVVDAKTGGKLTFGRAILRELFGKVLSTLPLAIGWGMVFIRADSRTLHDLVAGTVVKRVHT